MSNKGFCIICDRKTFCFFLAMIGKNVWYLYFFPYDFAVLCYPGYCFSFRLVPEHTDYDNSDK